MRKMLSRMSGFLSVALVIASCSAPGTAPSAATGASAAPVQKPASYKVGSVLPLSGPAAALGQFAREGFDLAIEEINAKGGVNGVKLEAAHQDGKGAARDSVDAFNKLASVDKPAYVVTLATAPLLAMAPLADQAGILLACGGCNSPVTHGVSKLYLNNTSLGENEGRAGLSHVVKKLNAKTLAILGTTDEAGKSHAQWGKDNASALGLRYLGTEFADIGAVDISAQVAKLKALNPDTLYLTAFGKDLILALRQLRDGGVNVPLVTQAAVETPDTLTQAGTAAENVYYGYAVPPPDKVIPALASFRDRYRAKYTRVPEQFAGNAYDLVYFLVDGIKRLDAEGKAVTGANLHAAMNSIKTFEGVGGATTFLPDGTCQKPVYAKQIKAGKFEYAPE